MATYTYTNSITQVDNATINFTLPSVGSGVTAVDLVNISRLTNQITSVVANMAAAFPSNPLPNSYNLTSTVAGMGAVFGDSVYRYESNFDSAPDDYESDQYFLVTTAIDAGIAALPIATPMQQARKAYVVSLRAQIDTYFNAASYANANAYIQYIEVALTTLAAPDYPFTSLTFVLSSVTEFTVTVGTYTPLGGSVVGQGGWYNIITNTLTGIEYPYTWNFDYTTGGSDVVDNTVNYPDGVYTNISSQMWVGSVFGVKDVRNSSETDYALVTTGITLGITNWQTAFNQLTNPSPQQIEDNNFLSGALAAIQAAFDAELFTEANALILQVQGVLAGGINILMYLNLATTGTKSYKEANMLNYFLTGALPSGVYTDQSSVLKNTITNDEYFFPSAYPASATDYTEVLNSLDLTTENKWNDAVYRSNVSFKIGETRYECVAYCLVLTRMDCVITKLTQSASLCGSLQTKLSKLISIRNMALSCFMVGNFTGANTQINKFNSVTATCNCGCR